MIEDDIVIVAYEFPSRMSQKSEFIGVARWKYWTGRGVLDPADCIIGGRGCLVVTAFFFCSSIYICRPCVVVGNMTTTLHSL